MREKRAYRDNLERIIERFPNQELLSISDVSTFTGVSWSTCKRLFSFRQSYISAATLARELSEED